MTLGGFGEAARCAWPAAAAGRRQPASARESPQAAASSAARAGRSVQLEHVRELERLFVGVRLEVHRDGDVKLAPPRLADAEAEGARARAGG